MWCEFRVGSGDVLYPNNPNNHDLDCMCTRILRCVHVHVLVAMLWQVRGDSVDHLSFSEMVDYTEGCRHTQFTHDVHVVDVSTAEHWPQQTYVMQAKVCVTMEI